MKFVLHTSILSPHQLPLALEIAKSIGRENFRYVFTEPVSEERLRMGWGTDGMEGMSLYAKEFPNESREWLETADVVLSGVRDFDLFEHRARMGRKTFYMSERWFRPITFGRFSVTGWTRLLFPKFLRMSLAIRRLSRRYDAFRVFPIGVYSRMNMRLIGVPEDKMTLWGYFVAPSEVRNKEVESQAVNRRKVFRVMWAGRMIPCKRLDTLVKAIGYLIANGMNDISLTLVGNGQERGRLEGMSKGLPVEFMDSVPVSEVRGIMRRHDCFVFPSNKIEGWGAVVNEALVEGLVVLGSKKAGAVATVLPPLNQFECGDWRELAQKLMWVRDDAGPFRFDYSYWTVEKAAARILEEAKR